MQPSAQRHEEPPEVHGRLPGQGGPPTAAPLREDPWGGGIIRHSEALRRWLVIPEDVVTLQTFLPRFFLLKRMPETGNFTCT